MTRSAWGPRWKYNQHGFYNSARGEIFCLTLGFFFPLACFCWTRRVVRYFPNPQASCNDGGGKKKAGAGVPEGRFTDVQWSGAVVWTLPSLPGVPGAWCFRYPLCREHPLVDDQRLAASVVASFFLLKQFPVCWCFSFKSNSLRIRFRFDQKCSDDIFWQTLRVECEEPVRVCWACLSSIQNITETTASAEKEQIPNRKFGLFVYLFNNTLLTAGEDLHLTDCPSHDTLLPLTISLCRIEFCCEATALVSFFVNSSQNVWFDVNIESDTKQKSGAHRMDL